MQQFKHSDNGSETIDALVSPAVRKLDAYHVNPATGMIKLDAMENPYEFPESLMAEWKKMLGEAAINRYPDPGCNQLKAAIRKNLDLTDSHALVLGNGSDELIQMIVTLIGGANRTILSPVPSFSMYKQICIPLKTRFVGVPLDDNFNLDRQSTLDAVERERPACIFFAYPNNPTGNCFSKDLLNDVLDMAPGLVVVDEAYFAFCGESWIDQISSRSNLVVLRTMSKSGLAGLRLGMMIANPVWANEIEKLRLPYNINSLTQLSARFFLQHYDVLKRQTNLILENREKLFMQLGQHPEIAAYPSRANFVLIRVKDAGQVFRDLQAERILVRNLHEPGTLLENCLRITVGTEEENAKFLAALKKVI